MAFSVNKKLFMEIVVFCKTLVPDFDLLSFIYRNRTGRPKSKQRLRLHILLVCISFCFISRIPLGYIGGKWMSLKSPLEIIQKCMVLSTLNVRFSKHSVCHGSRLLDFISKFSFYCHQRHPLFDSDELMAYDSTCVLCIHYICRKHYFTFWKTLILYNNAFGKH